MNITPDTNLLVRVVVPDDSEQTKIAARLLHEAEIIAVTLPTLCEFVWVLRGVYRFEKLRIAAAIEALLNADRVVVNRPSVEAGIAFLQAGGDFADGLIAHEGRHLGGEVFVSFDKKAVKIVTSQGQRAKLAI